MSSAIAIEWHDQPTRNRKVLRRRVNKTRTVTLGRIAPHSGGWHAAYDFQAFTGDAICASERDAQLFLQTIVTDALAPTEVVFEAVAP